jgi:hypothetical protein
MSGRNCCRVFALLICAVTTVGARAETVLVPAARDNTLFASPTGALSSGAGTGIFAGNNSSSNTRRALVFFDVAAAIPAEATVDSVELRLNVSSSPNTAPQLFTVHRVLHSWGEGSSVSTGGAGAPSAPGDATWIHRFYPDSLWTTPGGDFDPASHASTTIGPLGPYHWNGEPLTQDVVEWLASPAENFGWLVRGNEGAASTVRLFDSRESNVEPILAVYFTPIVNPTSQRTWGYVKSLYRAP